MRRYVATAALAALVPVAAWGAVSAEPDPPADCSGPAPAPGCVDPAPADPVEPGPAPEEPADPTSPVTEPSTTVADTAPTTSAPPTTAPEPTSTTTVPTDPAATTTTVVDPATSTTLVEDPNATTTTAVIDPAASGTEDPNATTTTTTVAPPPEDLDSDPVLPAVEAPGGRVVLPAGAVESGQTRPITFPVAGPVAYANDWGACRDGCSRAHKGNDVIGGRLQPILAMHEGVIDRLLDHPTAGFGVVIRDDEGWEYHVYHLNNDDPGTDDASDDGTWRFAAGIVPGARVTAGQLIGWMGDSGNSEQSVPHAHVEIHRPDGAAINPYWSLRQAQRDVNCAVASNVPAGPPDPAAELVDAAWLESGWAATALPDGWQPLALTGGRPGSDVTAARMWIGATGFTPVDAAALRVGDPAYDVGVNCAARLESYAVAPIPTELGAILATIRAMESGGDYGVSVTTSTASGAYGFLDSSWGGYGGYQRARDAPPPVQDAKAAELAAYILGRNGGDVSTIPVSWYIGHVPVGAEWDTVPPYPGNRLTPREYQERWMRRYAQFLGTPELGVSAVSSWQPVDTSATCRTVVADVGRPGAPELVLTQAQAFVTDVSGRAGLAAVDACDPGRAPAETPSPAASLATTPATPGMREDALDEPVIRPGGRR